MTACPCRRDLLNKIYHKFKKNASTFLDVICKYINYYTCNRTLVNAFIGFVLICGQLFIRGFVKI